MVYFNFYIKFIKCYIFEESLCFKVYWIGIQDVVVFLVFCNRLNVELIILFIRIKGFLYKY